MYFKTELVASGSRSRSLSHLSSPQNSVSVTQQHYSKMMKIRQAIKSVPQICCYSVSVTPCRQIRQWLFLKKKEQRTNETNRNETKRQQILAVDTTNYNFEMSFETKTRIKKTTTSDLKKGKNMNEPMKTVTFVQIKDKLMESILTQFYSLRVQPDQP